MFFLNRLFIEIDYDGTGSINEKKLSKYLSKFYDKETSKLNASKILSTIDVDQTSEIEFYEFRMCNVDVDPDILIEKLNEIRALLKKNNNGSFYLSDIINLLYKYEDRDTKKFSSIMESTRKLEIRENEYNNMCKSMIIDIKKKFSSKQNQIKQDESYTEY